MIRSLCEDSWLFHLLTDTLLKSSAVLPLCLSVMLWSLAILKPGDIEKSVIYDVWSCQRCDHPSKAQMWCSKNTWTGWWAARGDEGEHGAGMLSPHRPTSPWYLWRELCFRPYLFIHYAWPIYTVEIERKGVGEERRRGRERGRKWQFTKAANW